MVSLRESFSNCRTPLRPIWPAGVPSDCNRGGPPTPWAATAADVSAAAASAGLDSAFCHQSVLGSVVSPANSTRITTISTPRATPNTAPRKRSRKPKPTACTSRDSRKPTSAPTISTPTRIRANATTIARRRVSPKSGSMPPTSCEKAQGGQHADDPAARDSEDAHEAAHEREQRRQADDADDHEIECGHPTWRVTMPLESRRFELGQRRVGGFARRVRTHAHACSVVPLSVATGSVYAGKPPLFSLVASELAPLWSENAAICTTKRPRSSRRRLWRRHRLAWRSAAAIGSTGFVRRPWRPARLPRGSEAVRRRRRPAGVRPELRGSRAALRRRCRLRHSAHRCRPAAARRRGRRMLRGAWPPCARRP